MTLTVSGCLSASELRDFSSDGCTLFPDASPIADRKSWCDCCLAHDVAYWRGGTDAERQRADEALGDCVLARTGDKSLADLMYRGVRVGGHPAFPTWYRWGYGWVYGRGYAPLTAGEQEQARAKLEAYHRTHRTTECGTPPTSNRKNEED